MDLNYTGEVETSVLWEWDAFKAVMRGNIIAMTASMKNKKE